MDRKANFQNALVCRTWSDGALNEIWRNLDNLHAFLKIVAPLQLEPHPSGLFQHYLFSRVPSDTDWQRVSRYASLVRKFSYEEVPGRHPLSRQLFTAIEETNPHSVIFPNLRSLIWNPSQVLTTLGLMGPSLSLLFLHPGLTSISITLPAMLTTTESHGPTVLEIATRAPNLCGLTLITSLPPASLESDICTVITKLPKLERLILPQAFSTTRIFSTCSRLRTLEILKFGFGAPGPTPREEDHRTFSPDVSTDAFPALEHLALIADFPDIVTAVKALKAPQKLTRLEFGSRNVPAEDIGRIIDRVSNSSDALRVFNFASKSSFRDRNIDDIPVPIDLQILKPLTSIPCLSVLLLEHATPLALSLNDVDSLLSGLPYIGYLTLNITPVYFEESLLGLDVLAIAGKHCRHLRKLGVFVNATLPVTIPLETAPQSPIFPNLWDLAVGFSVITKAMIAPTALLLAKVLPVTCTLEYGSRKGKPLGRFPGEIYSGVNVRLQLWEEVDNLLKLLQYARRYERTTHVI